MKKVLTVLLLTAAALTAQASAGSGSTKSKAAGKTVAARTVAAKPAAPAVPAATKAQPLTIPKGAVANSDGSYSWTDPQGKKWSYLRTPFGISKIQVTGVPMAATSTTDVKVFDAGDKYRFELPTPFGVNRWEKSKAELTEQERNIVNSQIPSPNAKQE